MDLQLYLRVVWRFRFLVATGVVVAALLALFAYAKPSIHGSSVSFRYRTSELWEGDTTLLVTQRGFPWGRATQPTQPTTGGGQQVADPGWLSNLVLLYAQLANSDQVQRLLLQSGPVHGKVIAVPVTANQNSSTLPLITIAATATSPSGANALSQRAANAFITYLHQQQNAADIASGQRVVVQTVQQPFHARLVQPRKKTVPILIFGTVLMAVFGLAFLLENLRPQIRPVARVEAPRVTHEAPRATQDARRSA